MRPVLLAATAAAGVSLLFATSASADQVIPDDLIVQGSICVGLDCVNNENFGFDTIRLKENNTRIKFDDTSASAGFPANDWRLSANDSASGGASKFSARGHHRRTGRRSPSPQARRPTRSSSTAPATRSPHLNPLLDLHINTSNTPAIRLEQNNSGGFTAQTWDIGANEANFFVRDVTGGSRLPFRIRPGAPTSTIDIAADGDVGIGTATATQALHVERADGTARLLVEEKSTTEDSRVLTDLVNNGPALARFTNTAGDGQDWQAGNRDATDFVIEPSSGSDAFTLTPSGDATAAGALLQNADPAATESRAPVDGDQCSSASPLCRSRASNTGTMSQTPATSARAGRTSGRPSGSAQATRPWRPVTSAASRSRRSRPLPATLLRPTRESTVWPDASAWWRARPARSAATSAP